MKIISNDAKLNKIVKATGVMFLFTFLAPLYYIAYLFPNLISSKNIFLTVNNILNNELLFRIGIINELVCSFGAVIFAWLLYIIFKPLNRNILSLAALLKVMEALLLAVTALAHFISLLILKDNLLSTYAGHNQILILIGLFVNRYFYLGSFVMVFHGLSSMIFLYLFYKSKYIPAKLSLFGILSYALIFIYALSTILSQEYTTLPITQAIFFTPSILTELTVGLWLIIKGINFQKEDVVG